MKNCQNCGQANVDDAKFCELCGTSLEEQIQVENSDSQGKMKNCKNCGQANVDDAKFCKLCGMPLDERIQMQNWDLENQELMDEADEKNESVISSGTCIKLLFGCFVMCIAVVCGSLYSCIFNNPAKLGADYADAKCECLIGSNSSCKEAEKLLKKINKLPPDERAIARDAATGVLLMRAGTGMLFFDPF